MFAQRGEVLLLGKKGVCVCVCVDAFYVFFFALNKRLELEQI